VKPPKPPIPSEKVESLRARVSAGTYEPDLEDVAGAILRRWTAEAATYAWLKSVDQEVADPEDSADARSDTSSF